MADDAGAHADASSKRFPTGDLCIALPETSGVSARANGTGRPARYLRTAPTDRERRTTTR